MDILSFIVEEGLVMIPALFVVGAFIKGTEAIASKWIPLILLGVSIALTPLVLGGYGAENIVQAILVAGGAVYTDQLIKQTQKGE